MKIDHLLETALAYRYGINTHMNITKSIELFKQLADQGCSTSHYELSKLYDHHFCTSILPFNNRKRDEHLLGAARLGNIHAILAFISLLRREMTIYDSLYYPNKSYREQVVKEVFAVVERLTEQGNGLALIIKGAFIEDCTPQSVYYLHEAWLKGEKFLASLYLSKTDGEFLKQGGLENFDFWEEQNKQLLPDFMKNFENLFVQGNIHPIYEFVYSVHGTWFNHESSAKLRAWLQEFYTNQAEEGCSDAWLHIRDEQDLDMNGGKAVEYLRNAAELGNPVGAYEYAYALEQVDELSDEQFDEVKEYYRTAAEAKHPNALYEYGRYFIDDDLELALTYFKRSVALECTQAYLILAKLTHHEEQAQWADQALRNNESSDLTLKILKKAYSEGYGVKKDQERADKIQEIFEATEYWDNLLASPLKQATEKIDKEIQPHFNQIENDIINEKKAPKRFLSKFLNFIRRN